MKRAQIPVGFIPLVDAAPLIVAQEMGFAAEEGLDLLLKRAPSWSSLRDMLAFGQVDAAHMLAPVPVAAAMGLGNTGGPLSVMSVLSVNGTVIGISAALADRMRHQGHDFAFADARAAGHALIEAAPDRLRIAVPFPFSMHAELLYYWLSALGFPAPQSIDIRTVPPSLMADALRAGDVDAFCVGEPWGSIVVEHGLGALLLPGAAIWSFAPEKVLAVRTPWLTQEAPLAHRLIRAVWRAGKWLASAESRLLAAELLAREPYLSLPPEIIDRALSGGLTVTPQGLQRDVPGFLRFHLGDASYPWTSQAQWIAHQLAIRTGLDRAAALRAAAPVFRDDLYRGALGDLCPQLPQHPQRVEGRDSSNLATRAHPAPDNRFFDGQIFDPQRPQR
ncbi:ABC transporter substrate-binding protein [Epibacterium sp. Ofav1-8]|uniref:ABC transporter substrate-binding protein n=1 Tax=Epibacterium sp. Ofav1-8 TaxID=2917735 RepID=UPI001EF63C6D|nr:ABC transporter substrate-binding protein [Epibacterium sp. Ofav1-8]MCG7625818.1 ABC transporter substrate-binding protein [Epibacterium sp. Ofav1-8]